MRPVASAPSHSYKRACGPVVFWIPAWRCRPLGGMELSLSSKYLPYLCLNQSAQLLAKRMLA
eukprot:1152440-Pelagomonas_calceolata.AAC.6